MPHAIDPNTWVLDLRADGHGNTPDGLTVTNATAYGEANGHTLSAQRRSRDRNLALCLRLTAPDGKELNLAGFLHASASNASSPVASTILR